MKKTILSNLTLEMQKCEIISIHYSCSCRMELSNQSCFTVVCE